jgi:hypothetical protein
VDKLLTMRKAFTYVCAPDFTTTWSSPLVKYPLFSSIALSNHPDETINYLNDAYRRLSN